MAEQSDRTHDRRDGTGGHDTVQDWVDLVSARYPERDAASWDATGLQVGDPRARVHAVLVTLDVTDAVLDEAARTGADLVLAHHPLLFRPLERLTPATAAGHLALRAAREGVAILAAHTNFDAAHAGTTDPVVRLLDLRDARPLEPLPQEPPADAKLVVFVPHADTAAVLAALAEAGAGVIGEYDRCSFRVAGTGTFRPSPAANPSVGEREQTNEVAEDRLEVLVPRARLGAAVEALVDAHPYEEVAYDVYPLAGDGRASGKGLGRVGELAEPLMLREVADRLAAGLPSPHLRVAGDLDAPVRRVAACGGAGDGLLHAAVDARADVYVTGDLRHHVALDALTLGLALVDAGHYATEAAALPDLVTALTEDARRRNLSARLVPSALRTEPWTAHRSHSPTSTSR